MTRGKWRFIIFIGVFMPGIQEGFARTEALTATFRIDIDEIGDVRKSEFITGNARGKLRALVRERVEAWKYVPAIFKNESVKSATFITVEAQKVGEVGSDSSYEVLDVSLGPMMTDARPPKYPRVAESKSVAAEVLVSISVGTDGSPEKIETEWYFESAEGYEGDFVKAAHDQARTFRFVLEEVDGRPQTTKLSVPIRFCSYAPFHKQFKKGSCNLLDQQIREAGQTREQSLDLAVSEDRDHRLKMGLPLLSEEVVGDAL